MNNLQEFTNGDIKLPVRTNENGDIEFDAEKAAIGLGLIQSKNKKSMYDGKPLANIFPRKLGKMISSLSHNFTSWQLKPTTKWLKSFKIG